MIYQLGEEFCIFTSSPIRAKDPAEQFPPTRPPNKAQNSLRFTIISMKSTDEYATWMISGAAFFENNDLKNVQLKMEAYTHTKDEDALYQAIKSMTKDCLLSQIYLDIAEKPCSTVVKPYL